MTSPLARPVLSLATLVGLVVLLSLGTWQVHRLGWKAELIAGIDARLTAKPLSLTDILALPAEEREWRRVRFAAAGGGGDGQTAHVVGTQEGQSGYYVFALARLANGGDVPVNHGFVAFADREDAYALDAPGPITGVYRRPTVPSGLGAALQPEPDLDAGTFYGRNAELLGWLFGTTAPDDAFYIERTDTGAATALAPNRPSPELSNRHLGYVITWYGLAAILAVIYVLLMRRSPPPPGA